MTPRALAANRSMLAKLLVVTTLMFGFGYALVPMYRSICDALGINVLTLSEQRSAGRAAVSSQVDTTRVVSVEFDANVRGPWRFAPATRSLQVHPGQLTSVEYEFTNVQDRTMTAQAIPSYAPMQAASYFDKVECFCFSEWTLAPGETRRWPVVFVVDPRLPKDVTTITLSYTFFEVAGKSAATPKGAST